MTRQARLFAIAEHLRARRTGVTSGELAERFGVTVRTIFRDLDALREASLPLHAEPGRGGGYALDRHYTLGPINLSPREAAVLLTLVRYAVQLRLIPFIETLQSGADKVRAALSESSQRELLEVLDHLELTGVPAVEARRDVREAVEEALFSKSRIEMRFRRADGSLSTRTVTVERLVLERGGALVNVVDCDTGDRRLYPLHRVELAAPAGGSARPSTGPGSSGPSNRPTRVASKGRARR
jgi:predicted DNA-binding transcriptional regulator YafY